MKVDVLRITVTATDSDEEEGVGLHFNFEGKGGSEGILSHENTEEIRDMIGPIIYSALIRAGVFVPVEARNEC